MITTEKQLISQILALSKKLIAIPSTADNLQALRDVLTVAKNELQEYFFIEEFENNGIPSILIHNTNQRTKHFKIILNAHLDVVPGKKEQFYPYEKNGNIYGRGAYDMKAAAAVMILLFKHIAKNIDYPLALQLVTDEEVGSANSTEYQTEKGISADFAIIGEAGSNLHIKNKMKGHIVLKLTTKGISSHGAYPWLAKNPILYMHGVIDAIKKLYPTPKNPVWKTTVTVTRIETSNQANNIIPDDCSAIIDIRYIPEDKNHIIKNIKTAIHEKVVIEVLVTSPSHYIDPKNTKIDLLKEAILQIIGKEPEIIAGHGNSDMRFFPHAGIEFGPIGFGHHSDNEYINIKSLEDYYHILKNFLLLVK